MPRILTAQRAIAASRFVFLFSFVAGAVTLGALPAEASTPPSQDTSIPTAAGQTVVLQWTGTAPAGASGSGSSVAGCTGTGVQEDSHDVNVSVPAGAYSSIYINAAFHIEWDDAGQDLMLTVLHNGNTVDSSDGGDPEENVGATHLDPADGDVLTAIVCPYQATADTPYRATLTLTAVATSLPAPPSVPPPAPGQPRYLQQQSPGAVGDDTSGEMNVGYNPATGRFMLLANLTTMRMTLPEDVEDAAEPPLKLPESCNGLWEDVSFPTTTPQTGDPILSTDPQTGRTFVSQLTGSPTGDSIYVFSDDDGDNWTQGTVTNDGAVDHQSMVSGPYHAGQAPSPTSDYPNVVNYCSQSLPNGIIGCVRSDDGGLTFGPPIIAALNTIDCPNDFQFIHGHIRYVPDGTIYIPVNNCEGHQAILVSEDSGSSYEMRQDPNSTPPNGLMHSAIAPSADGSTLYHCYVNSVGEVHVSVSHDKAVTWTDDHNVSTPAGLAQGVFVAAVAGDADRATCGFLGTTSPGNYSALDFPGVWYGYLATTYDGGKNWQTIISTPGNPVQGVGGICTQGTRPCLSAHRNLLDFNEMVMDKRGYPLYAYDDGCTGSCDIDPVNAVTYVARTAVVRQVGGKGMLSSFDNAEPATPHRACLAGTRNSAAASLFWKVPDSGGNAISGYRIYRGTSAGSVAQIAQIGPTTRYTDSTAESATKYFYKVTALNSAGEGLKSNVIALDPSNLPPENLCTLPGLTQVSDADGDTAQAPPGFDDQFDIEYVRIAEPGTGPAAGKIVVTLKVRGFSVPPASGTRWVLRFNATKAPPSGQDDFFIAMTTEQGATPSFVYGTTGVTSDPTGTAGARTFTIEGDLEATSAFTDDGFISLVIDRDNPLFGPLHPGDKFLKMFGSIRAPATPNNNAIYDQTDEFIYTIGSPCGGGSAAVAGDSRGVLLGGAVGLPAVLVLGGFGVLRLRRRRR